MLLPALDGLEPVGRGLRRNGRAVAFEGAPPELLPRERELLRCADVVFTEGVSLGKAKAEHHHNVHAFPSGVDAAHYALALLEETKAPDDLAALPAPRIGLFGVIDERADLDLLRRRASFVRATRSPC